MKKQYLGVAALGVGLFVAERLFPLRRREPIDHGTRLLANGALAALTSVASAAFLRPAFERGARANGEGRSGVSGLIPGPQILRDAAAFAMMDLGYYWWHRVNHVAPVLWRFHVVHHIDPELDLSTGARFHFGEVAISGVVAAGWVVLVGIRPRTVAVFQTLFGAAVAFHHSNLRLPYRLERLLVGAIVTPRMHGVHHSERKSERDSNYSSIFSVWDRIFGTLRLDVPQDSIDIGVRGYDVRQALSPRISVALPLRRPKGLTSEDEHEGAISTSPSAALAP